MSSFEAAYRQQMLNTIAMVNPRYDYASEVRIHTKVMSRLYPVSSNAG